MADFFSGFLVTLTLGAAAFGCIQMEVIAADYQARAAAVEAVEEPEE